MFFDATDPKDAREIQQLKHAARKANDVGNFDTVQACINRLEQIWKNDRQAQAFYTELEQAAEEATNQAGHKAENHKAAHNSEKDKVEDNGF